MKLLDEKGLTTVWAAIKNTFTSKSDADGKYAEKSKALGSINFDYTAWGLNMSTYNVDGDGCGYINITSATSKIAGVMTASDKSKLDGIAAGANNYTLPIAVKNTLGGIKSTTQEFSENFDWPIYVAQDGKAFTYIPGLYVNGSNGSIKDIKVNNLSKKTSATYNSEGIIRQTSNGYTTMSLPAEGGTLALTSDIPNVSDLCKLNFVDSPSNCVEGRINMFTTTSRSISLNNIIDYGEGLILLLVCYSDSSYTIYCTDSDLYYKENLVDGGYKEDITRGGVFLVTIKGNSVYIYPLQ